MVHRLMRAVRFNCHEVLDGLSIDDEGLERVGFALNPNLAMINHSCDPNIGRVWLNGADHVIGERNSSFMCTELFCKGTMGCVSLTPAAKGNRETKSLSIKLRICQFSASDEADQEGRGDP